MAHDTGFLRVEAKFTNMRWQDLDTAEIGFETDVHNQDRELGGRRSVSILH